jgi:hypothetical protein
MEGQNFTRIEETVTRRKMNAGKGEACDEQSIRPFTQQEVAEAINSAKNRKPAGPDVMYNEPLKAAQPLLLETWPNIFNRSLETGIIPEPWRLSTMKVLYKDKGSASSLDAYGV